jgi:hypothetical protein
MGGGRVRHLRVDRLHVHGRSKTAEIGYGEIFLFAVGMILFPVGFSWELEIVSLGRYSAH